MTTKTVRDFFAQFRDQVVSETTSRFTSRFRNEISRIESPIEQAFAVALTAKEFLQPTWHRIYLCPWPYDDKHHAPGRLNIYTQASVGSYTLDFLLVAADGNGKALARIAAECDGHEFHERTKAQAEHDKRRDRYLLSIGVQVMRFTGSEIWRCPEDCVQEFLDAGDKALGLPWEQE